MAAVTAEGVRDVRADVRADAVSGATLVLAAVRESGTGGASTEAGAVEGGARVKILDAIRRTVQYVFRLNN